MALQSIGMEWVEYSDAVFQGMYPSATQVRETKKSFYAGALSVLSQMEEIGDDSVSEGAGIAHLESLKQELRAFFETTIRNEGERN